MVHVHVPTNLLTEQTWGESVTLKRQTCCKCTHNGYTLKVSDVGMKGFCFCVYKTEDTKFQTVQSK